MHPAPPFSPATFMSLSARNKYARRTREAAIFGMFGAMMFASKYLMEILPNIHLLAMFIGIITVVYRWRALIPIYVYVLLDGLFHGFSLWWIAYLYIFLPLFFGFLLLPQRMPDWAKAILYPVIAALHGFLFGVLYAPAQALIFGLDSIEKVIAWIAAGLPFDIIHGISNAAFGTLILPLSKLLMKLEKK